MNALRAWGSIAGGSLAIAGAVIPWLTLDGGLQRYGGTTGVYGWLVVAAGALAIASGVCELFAPERFAARAGGWLGAALAAFALWLLAGLKELVHRPDAAMLAPGAGPGLFVVLAGALIIVTCALYAQVSSLRPRL